MSSVWLLPAALVVVMCLVFVGVLRKVECSVAALHHEVGRLDMSRHELVQAIARLREVRAGFHRGSAHPMRR
ncbi:MAG: hypothetical protein JJE52_16910 [Acidimicrobiia bacterium]|nr:hypothetical protein [Acidimicrobiia bacterium]